MTEFIQGYRPDSRDAKIGVKWDLDHTRPKKGSGDALKALGDATVENVLAGTPPNCYDKAEEFTGYDLDGAIVPTQDDAANMCRGCPIKKTCHDYAVKAKPFGIWAGRRYGDKLLTTEQQEQIKSNEEK